MSKPINIAGERFHRLVAIRVVGYQYGLMWLCRCDCGNEKVVLGRFLRTGHTKSCGCLKKEVSAENCRKRALPSEERKRRVYMRHLKHRYNLSVAQYEKMQEQQKGKCAIPSCANLAEDVDHCHKTGEVRGLLCHQHNYALGLFNDNPDLLREAAVYLENCAKL